jgi:hypothetical protein
MGSHIPARRVRNPDRGEHFILILTNRSYLRRFSDCEFAHQFVSICFSGSEQRGHNRTAFGVLYWIMYAEIGAAMESTVRLSLQWWDVLLIQLGNC